MITTNYDFNDPRERDVIQVIIKGTPDMIPKYPSLYEMLSHKKNNRPVKFRTCCRCSEMKAVEKFASRTGFVCEECAKIAERIRRKKT